MSWIHKAEAEIAREMPNKQDRARAKAGEDRATDVLLEIYRAVVEGRIRGAEKAANGLDKQARVRMLYHLGRAFGLVAGTDKPLTGE